MTRPKPEHFPLTASVFCTNCECVSASVSACCCCGSHSLISLANILNRSQEEIAIESVLFGLEKGLVRK